MMEWSRESGPGNFTAVVVIKVQEKLQCHKKGSEVNDI